MTHPSNESAPFRQLPDDFTKLSFNAMPRTMLSLELSAGHTGLTQTDTLNRAVQVYAALTGLGPFAALRVLWAERATVRKFVAERRGAEVAR